jgi:hypothetical protein
VVAAVTRRYVSASDPITALVRRTRSAQGLPQSVTDATTLAQLAQLLDIERPEPREAA